MEVKETKKPGKRPRDESKGEKPPKKRQKRQASPDNSTLGLCFPRTTSAQSRALFAPAESSMTLAGSVSSGLSHSGSRGLGLSLATRISRFLFCAASNNSSSSNSSHSGGGGSSSNSSGALHGSRRFAGRNNVFVLQPLAGSWHY